MESLKFQLDHILFLDDPLVLSSSKLIWFCSDIIVYLLISIIVLSHSSYLFILDKKIIPKAATDVKLISAGKILENSKTVAQCRTPFGELPGGIITMHVVVQPSSTKTKTGNVS